MRAIRFDVEPWGPLARRSDPVSASLRCPRGCPGGPLWGTARKPVYRPWSEPPFSGSPDSGPCGRTPLRHRRGRDLPGPGAADSGPCGRTPLMLSTEMHARMVLSTTDSGPRGRTPLRAAERAAGAARGTDGRAVLDDILHLTTRHGHGQSGVDISADCSGARAVRGLRGPAGLGVCGGATPPPSEPSEPAPSHPSRAGPPARWSAVRAFGAPAPS